MAIADTAPLRIALAAGGTGGHVYPALSVAAELQRLKPEVCLLFIGGDRLEAQVAPEAGLAFRAIRVHGLAGRGLQDFSRRLCSAIELLLGIPLLQSLLILRSFRPRAVIGTGGYVSGPVLLAARLMRIPSITVEGNRAPGLTSRMVAKMVNIMAVGWPEQVEFLGKLVKPSARVVVTGLPIRAEVTELTREQGAKALGLDPRLKTLVVFGGSLGSKRINNALVGALRLIGVRQGVREIQILHITGRRDPIALSPEEAQEIAPGYRAMPYLAEDYSAALAAADLVVSRAGASTVAELTARGLPAILIPWSEAATGEQVVNAEPLARAGAAMVIQDGSLTPELLSQALNELLWDDAKLARMGQASRQLGKPQAAKTVAKLALELAN